LDASRAYWPEHLCKQSVPFGKLTCTDLAHKETHCALRKKTQAQEDSDAQAEEEEEKESS
jgi:hypothetical protein